jgi:predicted DNA-binding protein with PD1-like motif
MRSIEQPGPPAPERIQWVEARGRAFSFSVPAGVRLLEAVHRGFADQGFVSGTVNLGAGAFGPFAYVMPALSKTPDHAAFYSDTFRPAGMTRLKWGTMTLGVRDRAPFFHCHGLWTEADGRASGGHILPEETMVAEAFEVSAFGIDGAVFAAEHDPETNFKVFGPISTAKTGACANRPAFALRLRPNQDFANSLEAFCRDHGIMGAKLHGGVGSTIGARFSDAPAVEAFATELTVTSGLISSEESRPAEASLDVALVDFTGSIAEGRLMRGDNPVLMTMELVLEVLA